MKNNKKGFTLAELLIVVAIIAVLVAIAIPVFTAQTKRANAAVDAANIRAMYAEAVADYISTGETAAKDYFKTEKYTCKGDSDDLSDASVIGGMTTIAWDKDDQVYITINAGGDSWALSE